MPMKFFFRIEFVSLIDIILMNWAAICEIVHVKKNWKCVFYENYLSLNWSKWLHSFEESMVYRRVYIYVWIYAQENVNSE